MFIDYLTLLLINMTAGLFLLAYYLKNIENEDKSEFAPGFFIVGIIALVFGGYLTLTWPLPSSYNSAFGEMSVLFGVIYFFTGFSLYRKLNLNTVAIYAFFAGLGALILGIRLFNLHMTKKPMLTFIGFGLTGLAGIFSYVGLNYNKCKYVKYSGIFILVLAGIIWALTAYLSLWGHMQSFQKWIPR